MAGYDELDPLSTLNYGYRADALRNGSLKSYNGFVFPPALRSKITVVPEYSDDGVNVKYLTFALSIEFILTDGDTEQHAGFSDTSYISTTFANELLKKLTQPGQALHFTHDVLGEFKVNAIGGVLQDVDYGPKPQVIEVEPLGGGNVARVEWLCVTRIPPCMTNPVSNPFIQFSYSTSWGLDPSGYMIRTTEGSFELPSNRSPVLNSDHAAGSIQNPIARITGIKSYLIKQFPLLTGFRRQHFFRLRNNKKTLEFKFEDIEIRSDNIFPPGISDIELTQSITSSLTDGGFLAWKITYSGRLETVNGKGITDNFQSKKLAFYWLGIIIKEKRKRFEDMFRQRAGAIGSKQQFNNNNPPKWPEVEVTPDAGGQNLIVTYQPQMESTEFIIYPTHISIADSLYSNNINFTISYIAVISTELLAQAVGLFEPLDMQSLDKNSWVRYLTDSQTYTESVQVMPSTYPVVDLCHPLIEPSSRTNESSSSGGGSESESFSEVSYNESASNWIKYENNFEYLNSSMNVIGTTLSPETLTTTDTNARLDSTQALNSEQLKSPYEPGYTPSSGDTETQVSVYSPSKTVAYVKMTGYAIRIGKPIQAPYLIGVGEGVTVGSNGKPAIDMSKGGALAHKYGDDKIRQQTHKTGMKKNGKPVYIFSTSWEKTYVLDRVPTTGKITTSGSPGRFS